MLSINNKFELKQTVYVSYDRTAVSKGYISSITVYIKDYSIDISYGVDILDHVQDVNQAHIYATMKEAFE